MATPTTTKDSWHTTLDYITGRKRAEQALGFLTTAGARLTDATTLAEAVQGATDLAAPFLADWLSVNLSSFEAEEKSGSYVYVASSRGASADPVLYREFAVELTKYVRSDGPPLVLSVAEATGKTQQAYNISAELLRQATNAEISSAVVIPMTAIGRQSGLLTAFRASQRRDPEFDPAALLLLTDLATRLAATAEIFIARQAKTGA